MDDSNKIKEIRRIPLDDLVFVDDVSSDELYNPESEFVKKNDGKVVVCQNGLGIAYVKRAGVWCLVPASGVIGQEQIHPLDGGGKEVGEKREG